MPMRLVNGRLVAVDAPQAQQIAQTTLQMPLANRLAKSLAMPVASALPAAPQPPAPTLEEIARTKPITEIIDELTSEDGAYLELETDDPDCLVYNAVDKIIVGIVASFTNWSLRKFRAPNWQLAVRRVYEYKLDQIRIKEEDEREAENRRIASENIRQSYQRNTVKDPETQEI